VRHGGVAVARAGREVLLSLLFALSGGVRGTPAQLGMRGRIFGVYASVAAARMG